MLSAFKRHHGPLFARRLTTPSHHAPRISFSKHASYTNGLGGKLSAASWRKILSGIARSPLRFACNIRPRLAAAFNSAMRFLLAADTLGISAPLRQRPRHGVGNHRPVHGPTDAAVAILERRKAAPRAVMFERPTLMPVRLDHDDRLRRVLGGSGNGLRALRKAVPYRITAPIPIS